MNFSESKVLLKKINAIHDSIALSNGKISSLEKDLLLEYIRSLYKCLLDETPPDQTPSQKQPRKVLIQELEALNEFIPHSVQPNHQSESYRGLNDEGSNKDKNLDKKESPVVTKTDSVDPELEALFSYDDSLDLAQRFANTPISDVSRAMGINDRIQIINDLFKGDQKVFQDIVNQLNNFSSFERAKDFLIGGVASQNEWSSEKNKNKAEVFVKLVRRRFL